MTELGRLGVWTWADALATERAQDTHPYFGFPEHTARAREILGPDRTLAPEQRVFDAGASHVCIQPVHPDGEPVPHREIPALLAPGNGRA